MQFRRRRFVLWFLVLGFGLHFLTKFLLDQPVEVLSATANQQPWQRITSTILLPIKFVLIEPISLLMQDPDPPPPFRMILYVAYWIPLALGIHWLLMRRAGTKH